MEIKLTNAQFDLLQADLIKDVVTKIGNLNNPKFIDIKAEHIVMPNPDVKQISITIDKIMSLINFERENRVFTNICFMADSRLDIVSVNLTIDEIKKMIREAKSV